MTAMTIIPEDVLKVACAIYDLRHSELQFMASGLVFDGTTEDKLLEVLHEWAAQIVDKAQGD